MRSYPMQDSPNWLNTIHQTVDHWLLAVGSKVNQWDHWKSAKFWIRYLLLSVSHLNFGALQKRITKISCLLCLYIPELRNASPVVPCICWVDFGNFEGIRDGCWREDKKTKDLQIVQLPSLASQLVEWTKDPAAFSSLLSDEKNGNLIQGVKTVK